MECPKCNSKEVAQRHYEHTLEEEIFECKKCHTWYSETDLVEVETEGDWIWQ